jgi:hypothetical protein
LALKFIVEALIETPAGKGGRHPLTQPEPLVRAVKAGTAERMSNFDPVPVTLRQFAPVFEPAGIALS